MTIERVSEITRPQHFAMAAELSPDEFSSIAGGRPTKNAVVFKHGYLEWAVGKDGVKFLKASSEEGFGEFGPKTVVVYDGQETHLVEEIQIQPELDKIVDGKIVLGRKELAYKVATITDKEISFFQKNAQDPVAVAIGWSEMHEKFFNKK